MRIVDIFAGEKLQLSLKKMMQKTYQLNILQESVTPTSSIQPTIEEDVNVDPKKDDLTSVPETPPVQEIRFQTNPYSNNAAASATPTLPPVLGYASAAPFTTAPIETAGTIYHTGVSE